MPIIGYSINRIFVDTKNRTADYKMAEPHVHNHYELFYLSKGSCTFIMKAHSYNLVPGSVIIIPPNTPHLIHYTSRQQSVRTSILFREMDINFTNLTFISEMLNGGKHKLILQIPPMYQVHVEQLIRNMEAEQRFNDTKISPTMLSICLIQLIIIINRFSTGIDITLMDELHTTNRQVNLAATFINRNYNQRISLSDIADASGFSPNYLSRKFKEDTGIGVHEYLTYVRLNKAAIELAHTDHTVTEVALNNGFSDSNYFKDAFHKAYGMSPRDYRKKDKNTEAEDSIDLTDTAFASIPSDSSICLDSEQYTS